MDAHFASVGVVGLALNEASLLHALQGPRQAGAFHAHAGSQLGAGCSFTLNAEQGVSHTHGNPVPFCEACVQPGQFGPAPSQLKVDGLGCVHASKVHDFVVRA